MPIYTEWFLEKRVLRLVFEGVVTVEEIAAAGVEMRAYMDRCEVPLLHFVYDYLALDRLPISLDGLYKAAHKTMEHPRIGWTVAYRPENDSIFNYIIDIMIRVFRMKYRAFPSEREALDFLNSVDSTLPPLAPLAKTSAENRVS